MSAKNYYPEDKVYPYVIKAVMERVKLYLSQLLFFNDDPTEAMKRVILAQFDAGDNVAVMKSIETFKSFSSGKFPFLVYNIGDEGFVEYRSNLQKSNMYYDDMFKTYITAIPCNLTVNSSIFYTSANDYNRARTILYNDQANLTRLIVPLVINGVETYTTIDLDYEVTKGNFAFAFQQYLSTGKIFDISLTITIKYNQFLLVRPSVMSDSGKQEQEPVALVDDIIVSLKQYEDNKTKKYSFTPPIPEVTETIPKNGSSNIDGANNIEITFNDTIDYTTLYDGIDIVPPFRANIRLSDDKKKIIIKPLESLQSLTVYDILLNTKLKAESELNLPKDYSLKFTTK